MFMELVRKGRVPMFGLAMVGVAPSILPAQGARDMVLAAVHQLFSAMTERNTVGIARVMHPAWQGYSVTMSPDSAVVGNDSYSAFMGLVAKSAQRVVERIWDPTVEVHGAMATVWAPYDLHVDGKFAYCGVDAFTLARTAGGWKMLSITFTVEPTGCKASP